MQWRSRTPQRNLHLSAQVGRGGIMVRRRRQIKGRHKQRSGVSICWAAGDRPHWWTKLCTNTVRLKQMLPPLLCNIKHPSVTTTRITEQCWHKFYLSFYVLQVAGTAPSNKRWGPGYGVGSEAFKHRAWGAEAKKINPNFGTILHS